MEQKRFALVMRKMAGACRGSGLFVAHSHARLLIVKAEAYSETNARVSVKRPFSRLCSPTGSRAVLLFSVRNQGSDARTRFWAWCL